MRSSPQITIFISCVPPEFRTARLRVVNGLTRLGLTAIFNETLDEEGCDALQARREQIEGCVGLIQVVGRAYGAEPRLPTPEFGRVSFAQFEFLYARKQGKKTWIVLTGAGCQTDTPVDWLDLPDEPGHPDVAGYQAERRTLQGLYLEARRAEAQFCYPATNDCELDLAIERVGRELQSESEGVPSPPWARSEEAMGAQPKIYLDEDVQFTLYRPRTLPAGRWYTLCAFAHLVEARLEGDPDPLDELERQASAVLGETAREYFIGRQGSTLAIPNEGEITFYLSAPNCKLDHERASFFWREAVHRADFRIYAPSALVGRVVRGCLTAFLGHLIVAEIRFNLPVTGEGVVKLPSMVPESARPYRKVFASYSHRDVAIVVDFERHVEATGDRYLRDTRDLRAGESWNPALKQLIQAADIFQLFWSSNSMYSPFVREEWE